MQEPSPAHDSHLHEAIRKLADWHSCSRLDKLRQMNKNNLWWWFELWTGFTMLSVAHDPLRSFHTSSELLYYVCFILQFLRPRSNFLLSITYLQLNHNIQKYDYWLTPNGKRSVIVPLSCSRFHVACQFRHSGVFCRTVGIHEIFYTQAAGLHLYYNVIYVLYINANLPYVIIVQQKLICLHALILSCFIFCCDSFCNCYY